MAHSVKIYFLYVFGSQNIPEAACKEYPVLLDHLVGRTKKKITDTIKQHFDGSKDTEIVSESVESQWLFDFFRGADKGVKFGE